MSKSVSETDHRAVRSIGIVYQEHSADAGVLARSLSDRLAADGRPVWSAALRKGQEHFDGQLSTTDLMLVLGGDGSILSVARLCAPRGVPILGINFGRVGFLSELEPSEVDEQLPLYLGGDYWTDERTMLQADLTAGREQRTVVALNDIVLVRGAEPRVVRIGVWLDGHPYNTTVADGIIVSTATGSTAYNLAAGGPILHPHVRSSVLTPVAPHLAADRSLILEPGAVVTLELQEGTGVALLSADGQINHDVPPGAQVVVTTSPHVARFLRRRPPTYFYRILSAKLRDNL